MTPVDPVASAEPPGGVPSELTGVGLCLQHWEDDVRRFHRMFRHSADTELVVLVGNHDIGFHYE